MAIVHSRPWWMRDGAKLNTFVFLPNRWKRRDTAA
jgi:hypothetical protein